MSEVLPHITLDSGTAALHSIIWLHGLGADGEDFVPIVEQMTLPVPVRFIFPHAPMQPVTINGGYVMRAWYDIAGNDIGAAQDGTGIRASQARIEAFIAVEVQRGIAPANIFLAGFSQGGAIVLHTGLRHAARLGGLIALSTYLPLAESVREEAHPDSAATPIFMAHGRSDTVVPYDLGKKSAQLLESNGYMLDWQEYDMAHSVCMDEVRAIEAWLAQRLVS